MEQAQQSVHQDKIRLEKAASRHLIMVQLQSLPSPCFNVIEFNDKEWKLSKCSCYKWCKEYICKHILAFAERKGIIAYPIQAKSVKVGCNRRRGQG